MCQGVSGACERVRGCVMVCERVQGGAGVLVWRGARSVSVPEEDGADLPVLRVAHTRSLAACSTIHAVREPPGKVPACTSCAT